MIKSKITAEYVRNRLIYNAEDGVFIWRKKTGSDKFTKIWNSNNAGEIAGGFFSSHGYPDISIDGVRFLAHRLAWLHFYGEWPPNQIDHINLIRTDFRIENLRLATSSQNHMNYSKHKDNRSGYKGVRRHIKGLWQARIMRNGKEISLGYFKTVEEAAAAYANFIKDSDDNFARL